MTEEDNLLTCELCGRRVQSVSKHHLTPLQKGGKHTPTVHLCQPCHSTLHYTFSNAELAKTYNTIEKLKACDRLEKYLDWIKDKRVERLQFRRGRK